MSEDRAEGHVVNRVEVSNLTVFPVREEPVRRLAEAVLAQQGVAGSVTIAFVEAEEMARLNREYRGVEGATDVLSFGYEGDAADEAWPSPEGSEEGDYLGDVLISPEVAVKNAADDQTPPSWEVATLVVHGLLHLAGHDHQTDDGEMLARQEELLGRLWKDSSEDLI